MRAVREFPRAEAGCGQRATALGGCSERPRPAACVSSAALSWSAGERRLAGQWCGGVPIAVSGGWHPHCPAVLELPEPRGCAAPGLRRLLRPSARAEAEADHSRSGRSIHSLDLPATFSLATAATYPDFRPCRTSCSFLDQGGRRGARARRCRHAAVPSTALGLHEWILPHGTCPLCSPQCTKRYISLSSSARSGVFPVCISLRMGWILIFIYLLVAALVGREGGQLKLDRPRSCSSCHNASILPLTGHLASCNFTSACNLGAG